MPRKLAAAIVFLVGLAVIALADAPFIRHASVFLGGKWRACFASQFEHLPDHMNVVVLGSSRMWAGIVPEVIAEASQNRLSAVYNLATPGMHMARSAIVVDEIFDQGKTVDVLVVEANVDALRRGRMSRWKWPQAVAGRATWAQIVELTPHLIAHDSAPDPRIILRAWLAKLTQANLLVTTGVAGEVLRDRNTDAISICRGEGYFAGGPRAEGMREWIGAVAAQRFGDVTTAYVEDFGQRIGPRARGELQLLEHIRQRAHAAGARLIVVRPQQYGQPALHPNVIRQIQRRVPEFVHPPEPLERRLNTLVFDGVHYGDEGRALYSEWLAGVATSEPNASASSPNAASAQDQPNN